MSELEFWSELETRLANEDSRAEIIAALLESSSPAEYPEWHSRNAPEFGVYSVDEFGAWHDCEPLERPGY